MAEKRRELDVWIVQGNTVYRKVPYTVVTDWIQEGRLLGEDRVRSVGGDKWHAIDKVPALAAFLPRAQPFAIEDRAEALEPVEAGSGFDWRAGRGEEEEGDVDMIPLIDVSLVLLIFFMMTAAIGAGVFSPIRTPDAIYNVSTITKEMYWVGIDVKGPDGKPETRDGRPVPWYSVGKGEETYLLRPGQGPAEERAVTQDPAEVIAKLREELKGAGGPVRVRIRADRGLLIEDINAMTARLQELGADLNKGRPGDAKLLVEVVGEVSTPQNQ
jgi:biopolymer transport protein ExbD